MIDLLCTVAQCRVQISDKSKRQFGIPNVGQLRKLPISHSRGADAISNAEGENHNRHLVDFQGSAEPFARHHLQTDTPED